MNAKRRRRECHYWGATVPPRAGDVAQRPPDAHRRLDALPKRRNTSSRSRGSRAAARSHCLSRPSRAIAAGPRATAQGRQRPETPLRRPPSTCTRSNASPSGETPAGAWGGAARPPGVVANATAGNTAPPEHSRSRGVADDKLPRLDGQGCPH